MDLTTYDLVIFDCDGVLVDSERLTVEVETRILGELGWPLTPADVVARWMGRTLESQVAEIGERLGAAAALEFERRSTEEAHRAFGAALLPVPGVVELIDALEAAGVPTCVASSGSHERIRLTLGVTGLLDRFAGRIWSGTEVDHGKPAPDLFLLAADAMGAAPERSAVIEDSLNGVRAGVAAGMTTYGYAGGLAAEADLVAAGAVGFQRMSDLWAGPPTR